jgi:hypothetical protein
VGFDQALKVRSFVGTIAEGFALGGAATAEPDLRPPSKAIGLSFLIDDLHFAIY